MPKGYPRKNSEMPETPDEPVRRPKGNDALVTIEVSTTEGSVTQTFRVAGFRGNTLPWQRSGKGLNDILIVAMREAFGGQVTLE